MLLELHDDLNGHVEDAQLGLRLVRLQMRHAHAPQFLERFVDIPDSDPSLGCFWWGGIEGNVKKGMREMSQGG